jgi:hypothetical protein
LEIFAKFFSFRFSGEAEVVHFVLQIDQQLSQVIVELCPLRQLKTKTH